MCLAEKSDFSMSCTHLSKKHQQWEEDDENYLYQGVSTIDIFIEYKRNGTIYCAHPNYNSFGEWHDWAMIKF